MRPNLVELRDRWDDPPIPRELKFWDRRPEF